MAVSITVCNLALGELRAPSIADIDEATTEAAECGRYYPICLKLLLERYDWSFCTRIATLAALSVNPRASEWSYAYALPSGMASPKRLVPPDAWPTATSVAPLFPVIGQPYIIEAGTLYTHVSGAILEYSINDIDEATMTGLFMDALAYALAARLAVPLRDSREAKGQLLQQAEIAAQRAWADDQNRQPQRDATYANEVEDARNGYSVGC